MLIDFHIHILPGIDDGSPDWETSMNMARMCVNAGVTHIVSTSHGSSRNIEAVLQRRDILIQELRERLRQENLPLQVLSGIEYFADGHAADTALANVSCRSGLPGHPDNPILVELPLSLDIGFAADLLFQSQLKGVRLVLAHPERYQGFRSSFKLLTELMTKGLFLQFNSMDLRRGLFNWAQTRYILKLIEAMPEQCLIGSDAHNDTRRAPGLEDAQDAIESRLGSACWDLVSHVNPARLTGLENS